MAKKYALGRTNNVGFVLHMINAIFDGQALTGALPLGDGMKLRLPHQLLVTECCLHKIRLGADANLLAEHFVVADRNKRIDHISAEMARLTAAENRIVLEDQGLMAEVAGLVEYPHPVMGGIEESFMTLPPEVLIVSMRSHQKYFAVSEQDGSLAPRFITIANMSPDENRDAIIRAGNERVLRARLADARFFWDQDCSKPLAEYVDALSGITFFEGLGTMGDKAQRISNLAHAIAGMIDANQDLTQRAVFWLRQILSLKQLVSS